MTRKDRRPPPPGELITVGDLRLHVEARGGDGPLLLLLHGYLASTVVWQPALPLLGRRARAVAVDLPGCGYSDRPLDAPYDLPWFADQIPSILDALGAHEAVLVGHSLGGAIGLHVARRHPDRVKGLVLVSPLAYSPPPPPGLRLAKRAPGLMRWFFASPVGRLCIPVLARRATFSEGKSYPKFRSERLLEHLDAPGGWEAATRIGLKASEFAPAEEHLAQVTQPALICWGVQDRTYPVEWVQQLRDDLGGPTRELLLQRSGHNSHEEEADVFAQTVLDWLDELTPASVATADG